MAENGRAIFGGKRGLFEDLRDTNEDGRVGFGDTWLGDLLGFDGSIGVQGASYAESRSGARRRAAQSTTRPVARPARERQAELDAAERDFLAPYQQYGASRDAAAALQAEAENAPVETNANTTLPINPRLTLQEQRLNEQTESALGAPRVATVAEQVPVIDADGRVRRSNSEDPAVTIGQAFRDQQASLSEREGLSRAERREQGYTPPVPQEPAVREPGTDAEGRTRRQASVDATAETNANTAFPINPRLTLQEQRLNEQTESALGVPPAPTVVEQATPEGSYVTYEQWDDMTRGERENLGLPTSTLGWQWQSDPGRIGGPPTETPDRTPYVQPRSGTTIPTQQGTQSTETRPDIVMRNPPATAGTQDEGPVEVRVQAPDGRFIDARLLAQEQALERSPRPLAATTTPTGSSAPAGSSRPFIPAPESASMDVGMYNRFANRPSELAAAQGADPALTDSRTGLDSSFDSFPFNDGEPVPMDNIRQQAGRMQRQGNSATNGLMAPAIDGADLPRDMSRVNTPSGMPSPIGQDGMPNVDTAFRYERTRYTDRLESMLSDLRISEIGGRSSMEFFLTPMTPDKFTQLMSIIGPMDPQISLRLLDTYPELKDALEIGMAMTQGTN